MEGRTLWLSRKKLWELVKPDFSYKDLAWACWGNLLLGVGLGALLSNFISAWGAWLMVGVGIALVIPAKVKFGRAAWEKVNHNL